MGSAAAVFWFQGQVGPFISQSPWLTVPLEQEHNTNKLTHLTVHSSPLYGERLVSG